MDSLKILKEARKLAKNYEGKADESGLRIAVLGSCSNQYFVMILRYLLLQEGIKAEIYESEYDGIAMEALDGESFVYKMEPQIVILLPYYSDIKEYPPLFSDTEKINEYVEKTVDYYKGIWNNLAAIQRCQILQANFVLPPVRIMGNLETEYDYSRYRFFQQINEKLIDSRPSYVKIVDWEYLASNIGKYQWFDYPAYFCNKSPLRMDYMPEAVMMFVRQIKAILGKIRKCLVLDLDNTLWGGVVGDEGAENIQLDPNNALGEAYRSFQQYILDLKERGVILAVCSKNDEEIAKEPFLKNENMILRLEDISCFVANWEDKAGNIRAIAEKLNIGIDSLVFFDDNPVERELIKMYLPQVMVIDVPDDPAEYSLELEKESPFEWLGITREDLNRTATYAANQKRSKLMQSFVDYEEYLRALEMKGCVQALQEKEVGRFAQLIQKSNQFNLRSIRYSEEEIRSLMQDKDSRCISVKLSDKFSSYGIISCVILKRKEKACFIDTWVMSCRVLKRGVEYLMFSKITELAKEMGCERITAEYCKTKKNSMVKDFYERLGFQLKKENIEGIKEYEYEGIIPKIPYFAIEEERKWIN